MLYANTSNDFVCAHARQIGKRVAERCGLRGEDVEDCASGSVARVWEYLHSERGHTIEALPEPKQEAWMVCCVWHHTLNFRRHQALQRQKELPLDRSQNEGTAVLSEWQAPGPTPEGQVMQEAFRDRVSIALRKLSPLLRDALVSCELEGASLREYAALRGCTLKAAEQRLMRARKRLRQALEDQGDTEAVLRDYLSAT